MAPDEKKKTSSSEGGGLFRQTSSSAAPQPEPVKVTDRGPQTTSEVSDHKHRYQRFRVLGEKRDPSKSASEERCVVCNREKGSRG